MSKSQNKSADKKSVLLKVLHYIGAYRIWLVVSVIFAGVSVALTLYIPLLIGRAIDCIVQKGQVDFTALSGLMAETGIVALITALLQWLMNTVNNKITYEVVRDIRDDA